MKKNIPGWTHQHSSQSLCFMFNRYRDFRNRVHFNLSSEQADVEKSLEFFFEKESGHVMLQAAVGSHVIYIVLCVCVCWG